MLTPVHRTIALPDDDGMGDAVVDSERPGRLDAAGAARVAGTLQALATPSRLMILARLREGACAATELAAEVGMEQSACSHQLRVLRELGLVTGERREHTASRLVTTALADALAPAPEPVSA